MYNYTINLNDALNIASIAPNGTGNTASIGLGLYNYVNYSVGIWGDFQAVINERGSNMQLVKEVYLCIDGSDDIGAFYVTGFSTPFYCDENYVYRIPLHGGMTQNGQVNVLISCPGATTFTQLNAVTAHFEVEEYPFTLSAQQRGGVSPLVNSILKKEHLLVTVQATVANGSSVNVEVTDYSFAPTLVKTNQTVQVKRFTKTTNITLQNTTATPDYKLEGDVAIDPNTTNSLQMRVAIPSSVQGTVNAVLTLHGGGWASGNRGYYAHYKNFVLSKGLVYAGVDYTLISTNEENDLVPMYDEHGDLCSACGVMLTDIDKAISTLGTILANKGLTLGKVALMGYSAGGHLALLYAFSNSTSSDSPISLVVAEAAPTYFVPAEIVSAEEINNYNGTEDLDMVVLESSALHNYRANLIKICAGIGEQDDLNVISNKVAEISPLCQTSGAQNYFSAGGKVLLAYGIDETKAYVDQCIEQNPNTLGSFNDNTIKMSRATGLCSLTSESNCKLHVLYQHNHEELANISDLTDTCAEYYLEELSSVLQAFGRNEIIEFQ